MWKYVYLLNILLFIMHKTNNIELNINILKHICLLLKIFR